MAKYGSPKRMGKAIAAEIREAADAFERVYKAERAVIEAAKALEQCDMDMETPWREIEAVCVAVRALQEAEDD
jgi:hypothetical protein